jgi:hypothetical protein
MESSWESTAELIKCNYNSFSTCGGSSRCLLGHSSTMGFLCPLPIGGYVPGGNRKEETSYDSRKKDIGAVT